MRKPGSFPGILVPLDGSELAEIALPEAAQLARALETGIVLLQVIPPVENVIQSGTMRIAVDEILASQRDAALKYLAAVRSRPMLSGIPIDVVADAGAPAETILSAAKNLGVDRIVIATHGRTGLTRWVFGSVAEKVLQAADRTVVLVRAPAAA